MLSVHILHRLFVHVDLVFHAGVCHVSHARIYVKGRRTLKRGAIDLEMMASMM
jgi:hypothetical protein